MIPTINSYTLAQHIPNAQLILYPDSGHGAHFQYPDLFVKHAALFLDASASRASALFDHGAQSMTLWKIYTQVDAFTADEKKGIPQELHGISGRAMPKFYAGCMFLEKPADNI